MTEFKSEISGEPGGRYEITFYTDSKEAYKTVQAACRMCIDAERLKNEKIRHAHWLCREDPDTGKISEIICSECGTNSKDGLIIGHDKYCSACGSLMDEVPVVWEDETENE